LLPKSVPVVSFNLYVKIVPLLINLQDCD
jgi:hypothetical protein